MTKPLPNSDGMVPEIWRCVREGCQRRKGSDGYCSALCMRIDRRMAKIRVLIADKGISPLAAELWAATVSLSDQLSEVDRLEALLRSTDVAG